VASFYDLDNNLGSLFSLTRRFLTCRLLNRRPHFRALPRL